MAGTALLDKEKKLVEKPSVSDRLEMLQHMELALKKTGLKTKFKTVAEILATDENSAEFIRSVLDDDDYITPDKYDTIYEFAKDRARHSVVTFLMGLVFIDFSSIGDNITIKLLDDGSKESLIHLWMLTALYHDWAYHSRDLNKPDYNIKEKTTYYLFQDYYSDKRFASINGFSVIQPAAFAFTYEAIEAYDRYARRYHTKQKDIHERVDHGIFGGAKRFDSLSKKIIKRETSTGENELKEAKTSCLAIAQHNIFKSDSAETDKEYGAALSKFYHDSTYVISMDTPLLLLLSLVDTIECIKRFGKYENDRAYLQRNTILKSISFQLSIGQIVIDYSEFINRIAEKKDTVLNEQLKKYMGSVCGLERWTVFCARKTSDTTIEISLKPEKSTFSAEAGIAGGSKHG